jgi:hypothetical protein
LFSFLSSPDPSWSFRSCVGAARRLSTLLGRPLEEAVFPPHTAHPLSRSDTPADSPADSLTPTTGRYRPCITRRSTVAWKLSFLIGRSRAPLVARVAPRVGEARRHGTTNIAAKLGALARTAARAHFGQQRIEPTSLLPFGDSATSPVEALRLCAPASRRVCLSRSSAKMRERHATHSIGR